MDIQIVGANGLSVKAPAEHWLCGLIALLSPQEASQLMEIVAKRVSLTQAGPKNHQIIVPSIPTGERFGTF